MEDGGISIDTDGMSNIILILLCIANAQCAKNEKNSAMKNMSMLQLARLPQRLRKFFENYYFSLCCRHIWGSPFIKYQKTLILGFKANSDMQLPNTELFSHFSPL